MMRSPRKYESTGRGPPISYASSAISTCNACASAVEWTAAARIDIRRHVRMTRHAISPRLAMRIFATKGCGLEGPGGDAAGILPPELPRTYVDRAVAEH